MRAITKTEDTPQTNKDRLSENRFERINYYFKTIRDGKNSPSGPEDLLKEIKIRRKQEDKFDFRQAAGGEAYSQMLAVDREVWMKKHGINAERRSSIKFTKFIKELFDAFDEDGSQTLEIHEIVLPLLALGVAPSASYIEDALKMLLNVSDVSHVQIHREQFVLLFKADRKCDFILEVLNSHCDEMMCEEALRQQALYRSRNSKLYQRISVRQLNLQSVPIELKYNSMFDITRMIKAWWLKLDPEYKGLIKVGKVSEFLVDHKFASKKHEGRRLVCGFAALVDGKYVTRDHFHRIFIKSVFKGALVNIAHGLSHGEFLEENLSLKVKISEYQRKLVVSGLKVWDNKLIKEGAQAVQAVSEYKQELERRRAVPEKRKAKLTEVSSVLPVDMMRLYNELNSIPAEITGQSSPARSPDELAIKTTERLSIKMLAQQHKLRREHEILERYQGMVAHREPV
jgi:hypothetical protein